MLLIHHDEDKRITGISFSIITSPSPSTPPHSLRLPLGERRIDSKKKKKKGPPHNELLVWQAYLREAESRLGGIMYFRRNTCNHQKIRYSCSRE